MITLDDLVAQARDLPEAGTSERGTVRLEREEDVLGALIYFGQDDRRERVRLVVRGEDVGFLERSAVLSLFQTMTKGVGDSAGSQLPGWPGGRAYELLELRCPVKECPDSPVFAMLYDEDAPPACRIHPDNRLELHR